MRRVLAYILSKERVRERVRVREYEIWGTLFRERKIRDKGQWDG